jgi:hypothetical protein
MCSCLVLEWGGARPGRFLLTPPPCAIGGPGFLVGPRPAYSSLEARESPESSGPASGRGDTWDELDTERARREMAESTLREGMAEEQRRREEAERERDDLRQELYALREARESPQSVEEGPERAETRSVAVESQEPVQRPWWRRVFGR